MPTTAITLAVETATNWTNASNALVSDGATATCTQTGPSSAQISFTTNASTVIPANAIVTHILVTARLRVNSASATRRFYLREVGYKQFGGDGSPYAAEPVATTLTTYTLCNVPISELGLTQENCRGPLVFRHYLTSGNTMHIDHIGLTFTWLEPPSGSGMFFGENF